MLEGDGAVEESEASSRKPSDRGGITRPPGDTCVEIGGVLTVKVPPPFERAGEAAEPAAAWRFACSMDGTTLNAPMTPYAREVRCDSLGISDCCLEGPMSVVIEETCSSRDEAKSNIGGAYVVALKGLRALELERHVIGTEKGGVYGGDSRWPGENEKVDALKKKA